MKALSIRQPWASLIAAGAKRIETRSWATPYRGPLAIHAAVGRAGRAELADALGLLQLAGIDTALADLPYGAIVAVARLDAVISTNSSVHPLIQATRVGDLEHRFGDFSADRYGWALGDVLALEDPIPCRGMLGLWVPRPAEDPERPQPCELAPADFARLQQALELLPHPHPEPVLEG